MLAAFVIYLIVLVIVGILTLRLTKTLADFVLAGRKLGPWVAAVSAKASSESGWLLIGLPGQAFAGGFSAFWVSLGVVGGTFFNWTVMARRLRRITEVFNAVTIPDYLEERFDDGRTHGLRILSGVIITTFMAAYVAAQFVASGKALSTAFDISYLQGVLIGAAVILFYTMMGGFFAVAWTDLIQGMLMVGALVFLPVVAIANIGGFGEMIAELTRTAGADFITMAGGKSGLPLFAGVIGSLGIGLGYPGQPHVLVRFMAIRSPRDVRMGALITGVWTLLSLYGAVLIGLAAKAMLTQNPGDPERVMPLLALEVLPPWLAGVMIAAAMAAMMSTADSMLLVATASVVQDFYNKLFRRSVSERNLVRTSRVVTLAIGALAFVVALGQDPNATGGLVFWLVLFAWGGLGASFGPPLILSLYWKRVTRAGAYAGIASGAATILIWHYVPVLKAALYELVPGFFVSLAAVYLVSLFTRPPGETVLERTDSAARPLPGERGRAAQELPSTARSRRREGRERHRATSAPGTVPTGRVRALLGESALDVARRFAARRLRAAALCTAGPAGPGLSDQASPL
jgi:sodium/proline symporter